MDGIEARQRVAVAGIDRAIELGVLGAAEGGDDRQVAVVGDLDEHALAGAGARAGDAADGDLVGAGDEALGCGDARADHESREEHGDGRRGERGGARGGRGEESGREIAGDQRGEEHGEEDGALGVMGGRAVVDHGERERRDLREDEEQRASEAGEARSQRGEMREPGEREEDGEQREELGLLADEGRRVGEEAGQRALVAAGAERLLVGGDAREEMQRLAVGVTVPGDPRGGAGEGECGRGDEVQAGAQGGAACISAGAACISEREQREADSDGPRLVARERGRESARPPRRRREVIGLAPSRGTSEASARSDSAAVRSSGTVATPRRALHGKIAASTAPQRAALESRVIQRAAR